MNALANAPAIVQQLAARAGGTLIKWRETDSAFILVFEDGRKLTIQKNNPELPRSEQTIADMHEHIGVDSVTPRKAKRPRGE